MFDVRHLLPEHIKHHSEMILKKIQNSRVHGLGILYKAVTLHMYNSYMKAEYAKFAGLAGHVRRILKMPGEGV